MKKVKKMNERQVKRKVANFFVTERVGKNMTQAQFAKYLRTSQSMISKIERAQVLPNYKILHYLGLV